MRRIVVYPGSFDPITKGHVNIIQRAITLFDEVIVTIATNTRKQSLLTIDERLTLIKKVFADHPSVRVESCAGLTVDFARQHEARAILRGVRVMSDYDNELQLAGMNHLLANDIETVLLPASGEFACIAASIVREIYILGGDISAFVPQEVTNYLAHKERCL